MKNEQDGVIIQSVELFASVTDCSGRQLNDSEIKRATESDALGTKVGGFTASKYPFYETFKPGGKDTLKTPSFGKCTKGRLAYVVSAKFYQGTGIPITMIVYPSGSGSPSGKAPMSNTDPGLLGASGAVDRTFSVTWDCCPDNENPTVAEKNRWSHFSPLTDMPLRRLSR